MARTEIIWQPQPGPQKALVDCPLPEIFFGGARGGGKCIPLTEPVLTPFGWRQMRDIKRGSQVCNPNGTISRVLATYRPGKAQTYRVRFSDGAESVCDDGHIWLGKFVGHKVKRGGYKLYRFEEIRRKYENGDKGRFIIPLTKPVTYTRPRHTKHGDRRPLDGYMVGVLLGDGCLTGDSVRYATEDPEIDDFMAAFGDVRVDDGPNRRLVNCRDIIKSLKHLRMWGKRAEDKAIPDAYMWADEPTRWSVLQGLMDTDGTADSRGQCYFSSCSYALAFGLQHLARSLGFKATLWTKATAHMDAHTVYVRGPERERLFRLERKRKRAAQDSQAWHNVRRIVSIEPEDVQEVGCFQVDDPNGLFITRDFVVTHNTDGVLGKWALKDRQTRGKMNAVMFRRNTTSADDAIERARELYEPLGAKFNQQRLSFRMPCGSRVSFRYLDKLKDADQYQGRNLTDVWIEEAGQYAEPSAIYRLHAVLRSGHGVPTQMILTANPGGPGQGWLANTYQLHPLPETPKVVTRELPNGHQFKAAVIPSRVYDNQVLLQNTPDYIDRLHMSGSKKLVQAWLDGDWSAIEGAYFDEWDSERHVLEPFEVPKDWTRFLSFDWGSARPFSVGWWAIASDDHGKIPRGALVRYREWYGCGDEPNRGLKLTAEEVGEGIAKRGENDPSPAYGVADPAAFAEDGGPSIMERIMQAERQYHQRNNTGKNQTPWRKADNKRVSRDGHIGGWDQMRQRLRGDDKPMLFVLSTCYDFIRTIPTLQHDADRPEDLDTESEDHIADEARYACMSRPWVKSNQPEKPEPVDAWGRKKRSAAANWMTF